MILSSGAGSFHGDYSASRPVRPVKTGRLQAIIWRQIYGTKRWQWPRVHHRSTIGGPVRSDAAEFLRIEAAVNLLLTGYWQCGLEHLIGALFKSRQFIEGSG